MTRENRWPRFKSWCCCYYTSHEITRVKSSRDHFSRVFSSPVELTLRCNTDRRTLGKRSRCCLRGDRSLFRSYMATCSRRVCPFRSILFSHDARVDSLGSTGDEEQRLVSERSGRSTESSFHSIQIFLNICVEDGYNKEIMEITMNLMIVRRDN